MVKYYYLSLDTETGGIGDDKSLLTAYFGLHNDDFDLISGIDLVLKPDSGVYVIDPDGLAINGIDLVKHNEKAITYKEGGTVLYNFLKQAISDAKTNSNGTFDGKLIPIGHNIPFDIRKVKQCLISEGSWDSFVSYRILDTCPIAQFLRIKGFLPADLSCSAESLAAYLGVVGQRVGKAHEAKYDALTAVDTLKKLMELV